MGQSGGQAASGRETRTCGGIVTYDLAEGMHVHDAVLRTSEGLSAYRVEVIERELQFTTIDAVSTSLDDAWKRLSDVRRFDTGTAIALLTVLIGTLPDRRRETPHAAFELPSVPPPPRATAAHPRAYRGTTYKPPKSNSRVRLDLRPHLNSPGALAKIWSRLLPHLDEAVEALAATAEQEQPFAKLAEFIRLDPRTDIYLAFHHDAATKSLGELPDPFVRELLPWLRGADWDRVAEVLANYWQLGLADDPAVRRGVSWLLRWSASHPNRISTWFACLQPLAPAKRRVALEALSLSDLAATPPPPGVDLIEHLPPQSVAEIFEFYESTDDGEVPRLLVEFIFDRMASGTAPTYQLEGQRLNHRYGDPAISAGYPVGLDTFREFPRSFFENLMDRLVEHDPDSQWMTERFWKIWPRFWQLDKLLEPFFQSPKLSTQTLSSFCELTAFIGVVDEPESYWKALSGEAQAMLRLLEELEVELGADRASLWCAGLKCAAGEWDDAKGNLQSDLFDIFKLLGRVCRLPKLLSDSEKTRPLLSLFYSLDSAHRERVLCAPERAYHTFLNAGGYAGARNCIEDGARDTGRLLPTLSVDAFEKAPRKFARVLEPLGAMGEGLRRETLLRAKGHPLMNDLPPIDPEDSAAFMSAVEALAAHCGSEITSPLPKKARVKAAELRPGQRVRAWELARSRIVLTRLDVLNRYVWEVLNRGFGAPVDQESSRHALAFSRDIVSNDRALKKLLRRYWKGERHAAQRHPASVAWLSKQTERIREVWLSEVRRTQTAGDQELTFALEHDSLEVLRMGTYVGSCLGLGGWFSESAAAVVLDINKNVIYARTGEGRIVGRQLVALSDSGQLVCFSVYPYTATAELKRAFWSYDQHLAEQLGTEIYREGRGAKGKKGEKGEPPPYTVSRIVSKNWYDDGEWFKDSSRDPLGEAVRAEGDRDPAWRPQ